MGVCGEKRADQHAITREEQGWLPFPCNKVNVLDVGVRDNIGQMPLESPKTEAGEIDARAPFQSVKAAVSLFGNVSISRQDSTPKRSRLSSSETDVSDKETQMMLAEQELETLKQCLESSENVKTHAMDDLERAQRTITALNAELEAVNKSKQSAVGANEATKLWLEKLDNEKSNGIAAGNKELENTREQYLKITAELDAAKQELTKLRQDSDVVMEAKLAALHQAKEAQGIAAINVERINKMSKMISDMTDSIHRLNLAALNSQQEQVKIANENGAMQQSYAIAIHKAGKRLDDLKQEYDPKHARELEQQLAEITSDIEALQEDIKHVHVSEMNTVKETTKELNGATATLQQVVDEECSLRSMVSSLRVELEEVRSEQEELKEKKKERLATEEQERLDSLCEEGSKAAQMLFEAENRKREADEMKINAELVKQEAEATRLIVLEAEKQLKHVLRAVEKAKEAEQRALQDMKILTEKQDVLKEEPVPKIKISVHEFESLKGRREESEKMAEAKVVSFVAQLEDINANRTEADRKLEMNLKALEEIKKATDIARRSAEIAEEAHNLVDAELRKYRPQGQ